MSDPASTRRLFHHDGSPAAQQYLESLVADVTANPGRALAVFRAWPSLGLLAWCVVPAVLLAVLAVLISPEPLIAVVPLALGLGVALVFVVAGWFDRIRVHERALVLGFRGRMVIPWETVDPGRVYAARGAFLGRHVDAPAGATRGNAGPMVVVNGYQRPLFAANVGAAPERPARSPFGWYLLAARDPRPLLSAMEGAMVGAGLQEARGLAASTLASRRIRAPYRTSGPPLVIPRDTTDPPVGPFGG